MPEGHTIHRIARHQQPLLAGTAVGASSPQGRFAAGAERIDGGRIPSIEAYGKHLFYEVEPTVPDPLGVFLHVHLGLYGKFTISPAPGPEPRGALRLRLTTAEVAVDLRGPTACELVDRAAKAAVLARLGPDPLRADADPLRYQRAVARSRTVIGALLMDQSVLAGVGNVYRAEVLFRAGVGPHRPGRDVSAATLEGIWADLVVLLRAGVKTGRIVTTRPEDREAPRRRGGAADSDRHYVYRRAGLPCRRCGAEIRTEVLVGRNLFWCPHCQPD